MTMARLFSPKPDTWGLRGDPYVWAALRDHLTMTPVPGDAEEVEELLVRAFLAVVGVDLRTAEEESVFREEFAHGGMSSGTVHLATWRDRLIPLLVSRADLSR
ncbi:hypothetical protein ACIBHX_34545 [Nonomuraea sp. NPDC050536]|uniref:hypothetical protein n=1 Tax=Nonomuraea sp. NPDC050536 TaxID=3364366 RepID=UPI0037C59B03